MKAEPEPFDIDKLISLEKGVQTEALKAFFEDIVASEDAEKRNEIARFANRAGWRVLPEILADDSPRFFKPIKRYVFAASCRALFAATHPDEGDISAAEAAAAAAAAANTAADFTYDSTYYAAVAAIKAAATDFAAAEAEAAAAAANTAVDLNYTTPWQPLLTAMREDVVALHENQTLAGSKLWPKEAAFLFDVNGWFGAFLKNLERFERGREIPRIYEALLSGRIEQVIREYPPDLFEDFFNSAKNDYDEWNRGHTADDEDSTEESVDEEPPAGEKKAPRDTLHSEGPSGTDHLDRDRLAEVLSTWLKKNQSHKAIGLFGDWGVGKSTFVNLLRKRLGIPLDVEEESDEKPPPDHYKTADYIGGEFNAWQYEHTDNIQAGLAQELISALQANLNWWEKGFLAVVFAFKYNWLKLLIGLGLVALATIFFFVGQKLDIPWFSGLAGIAGLAAIWNYGSKAVAHPLAKQLLTYLRLPSFGKELGTIPVMREQVKAMVNLRLDFFKQKQRLLFVVDDLDRCSPDAVVKVLEAVRLVMDLPNVVVLIAIDPKIALASLALRYKELAIHYGADPKSIARQYLGKVIHVPITLDNPPPKAVENYLQQKLWDADGVSETAIEASPEDESVAPDSEPPDKTTTEVQASMASSTNNDLQKKSEPSLETPAKPLTESSSIESSVSEEILQAQPERYSIGLNQGQKAAFIKWANKLGLANPRHIKRLDNAYNLIRMHYPDEDEAGEPYYRLLMLMWIEYSRELQLDTYAAFRNYVRSEMEGEPSERVKALREELDNCNKQVGLFWDEAKAVWEDNAGEKSLETIREAISSAYFQVRTFVLPAIEKDQISKNIEQNSIYR